MATTISGDIAGKQCNLRIPALLNAIVQAGGKKGLITREQTISAIRSKDQGVLEQFFGKLGKVDLKQIQNDAIAFVKNSWEEICIALNGGKDSLVQELSIEPGNTRTLVLPQGFKLKGGVDPTTIKPKKGIALAIEGSDRGKLKIKVDENCKATDAVVKLDVEKGEGDNKVQDVVKVNLSIQESKNKEPGEPAEEEAQNGETKKEHKFEKPENAAKGKTFSVDIGDDFKFSEKEFKGKKFGDDYLEGVNIKDGKATFKILKDVDKDLSVSLKGKVDKEDHEVKIEVKDPNKSDDGEKSQWKKWIAVAVGAGGGALIWLATLFTGGEEKGRGILGGIAAFIAGLALGGKFDFIQDLVGGSKNVPAAEASAEH